MDIWDCGVRYNISSKGLFKNGGWKAGCMYSRGNRTNSAFLGKARINKRVVPNVEEFKNGILLEKN